MKFDFSYDREKRYRVLFRDFQGKIRETICYIVRTDGPLVTLVEILYQDFTKPRDGGSVAPRIFHEDSIEHVEEYDEPVVE